MRFKGSLKFGPGLLAVLMLAACNSGGASHSSAKSSSSGDSTASLVNSITGLPGGDGPVLVTKIDDTPAAHPQIGLDQADVVYIEQVEGGLTRIAAVFSNPKQLPQLIGPIRSARISDLDLFAQYGKFGFAFSGAQTKFLPVIRAANLYDLSAEINPPAIYSRDSTRTAPTNMILHPGALLAKASAAGENLAISQSMWTKGNLPTGAIPIKSVKFRWPASKYQATWSASAGKWLISYNGKPDLAASGQQLAAANLVLQEVAITPSIYFDKLGGNTPFSNTIGSGTAYLLRDGQMFPLTWSRSDGAAITKWSLANGQPAVFATGQTWIGLTDQIPTFTYPAAPSANSSGQPAASK
jgi:hypothetical protein